MCTADCLHEQELWILMRSSCERRWYTFVFRLSQVFEYWQLPIRNSEEWFGRWYEAVATGHVPRCVGLLYLIETPGDLTRKSWKHTTLWFPGGSSHYRWWSAILVTTAMTQPPPLLSPILQSASEITYIVSGGALNSTHSLTLHPPTSAPPPFNEGLGISPLENCGIKDVWLYVLEHFDGLMRLIIFPWNKKVNSPHHFLNFCRPRISVTHFASPGMPLDAPGCCGSEG